MKDIHLKSFKDLISFFQKLPQKFRTKTLKTLQCQVNPVTVLHCRANLWTMPRPRRNDCKERDLLLHEPKLESFWSCSFTHRDACRSINSSLTISATIRIVRPCEEWWSIWNSAIYHLMTQGPALNLIAGLWRNWIFITQIVTSRCAEYVLPSEEMTRITRTTTCSFLDFRG